MQSPRRRRSGSRRTCSPPTRCTDRAFLETEMSRIRLLVSDGEATKPTAPTSEQLAAAMAQARHAFDRTVYQTIAADRGHVGRAFAALDRVPRTSRPRWRNNFRVKPWCIPKRLLCDGKRRGTKRRAVPDIEDFLLLLEADHGHRIPIAEVDPRTTKVRSLLEAVARHSGYPSEEIRVLLGNAVPERTLADVPSNRAPCWSTVSQRNVTLTFFLLLTTMATRPVGTIPCTTFIERISSRWRPISLDGYGSGLTCSKGAAKCTVSDNALVREHGRACCTMHFCSLGATTTSLKAGGSRAAAGASIRLYVVARTNRIGNLALPREGGVQARMSAAIF